MTVRKRRPARVRPTELVVGLAAAGLLTAGFWPAAPAAPGTAPAAASAPQAQSRTSARPPVDAAPAVPAPAVDAAAAVAAGPGMPVPQPPRPTRTGRVVTPIVGVGKPPELTERPAPCGGHVAPRRVSPGVVPGPGSATVSWRAGGRAEVLGYRVTAVSQTLRPGVQPAPVQVTVGQPADCAPVTLAVPGLAPGTAYVFWLEEETVDARTQAVTFEQIGTSEAVVIGP